ncbi:MAG: lytic murein transglycosylase B [Gammaproteobacteria bacterium]|nr:lytic murein transglycosylase B [Gammaproteobacteria bacterium]
MDRFITTLVQSYDFDRSELEKTFSQARYLQSVIDAITRPAEKLDWYRYKRIFLTEDRINGGVDYWQRHQEILSRVEEEFGVPAEIIVAIIGIETRYGSNKGGYRVIDSLSTLAFHYPKRARFFRSELEQFLLLTREQQVDPMEIKGSYAGAMGIPQFIASSYRNYAIDFDGDDYVNLWDNHEDAIGSVANYFSRHGWINGAPVIYPVTEMPVDADRLVQDKLEPETTYESLQQAGVESARPLTPDTRVALLEFEETSGPVYWVGLKNFYVITRYNHSQLYALAAYLLSREILERYQQPATDM